MQGCPPGSSGTVSASATSVPAFAAVSAATPRHAAARHLTVSSSGGGLSAAAASSSLALEASPLVFGCGGIRGAVSHGFDNYAGNENTAVCYRTGLGTARLC